MVSALHVALKESTAQKASPAPSPRPRRRRRIVVAPLSPCRRIVVVAAVSRRRCVIVASSSQSSLLRRRCVVVVTSRALASSLRRRRVVVVVESSPSGPCVPVNRVHLRPFVTPSLSSRLVGSSERRVVDVTSGKIG